MLDKDDTCTADTPSAAVLVAMENEVIGAMPLLENDGRVGTVITVDVLRARREVLA